MRTYTTAGAGALVALSLLLVGCGSGNNTDAASSTSSTPSSESSASSASSSEAPSSSAAPATAAPAAGPNRTLADFVKENGLTATPIKRGDPGSPTVELPTPVGWKDAGAQTPPDAWGGIMFADPNTASAPATIIANMTKLTGTFDQAKIFDYAPGEVENLPGFQGSPGMIAEKKLGGYEAYQVAGLYEQDGAQRMVAQKSVVIPAKDGNGVYVLQVTASGVEDQMGPLLDATTEIDDKTTITP